MHMKDKLKKLDHLDLALAKLSLVFIVFFLLKVIPSLMNWVNSTGTWTLAIIAIILAARPAYKCHKK